MNFSLWKYGGLVFVLVLGLAVYYFTHEPSTHLASIAFMLFGILFVFLGWEVWRTINKQQETIEQLMGLKLVLASLIDLKDTYTEGHSKNVRDFALGLSSYLELPKKVREDIGLAAELHDIGKIGIPDEILKRPGGLNGEEYIEIKDHPQKGVNSLRALKGFDDIRTMIRHHHERYDGKGYPDKLAGNEIPLGARIIALADTYDAMLHGRSYRKAMPPEEVIQEILSESGKQFDPALIPKFLEFLKHGTFSGNIDPVCGMLVDPNSNQFVTSYSHQKIRFCSKTCLQAFTSDPKKYMKIIEQQSSSSFEKISC